MAVVTGGKRCMCNKAEHKYELLGNLRHSPGVCWVGCSAMGGFSTSASDFCRETSKERASHERETNGGRMDGGMDGREEGKEGI